MDSETCNCNDSAYKAHAFALTFAFLQPHRPTEKSKRECKQPHPFAAGQTVNNVGNSVYIQQRQHFGQTEGQLITAVWQKWRFSARMTVFRKFEVCALYESSVVKSPPSPSRKTLAFANTQTNPVLHTYPQPLLWLYQGICG